MFGHFSISVFCFLAFCSAFPEKKAPQQKECIRKCPEEYTPICGKAKNSSKERLLSFGSECVMKNYNCEHADDGKLT